MSVFLVTNLTDPNNKFLWGLNLKNYWAFRVFTGKNNYEFNVVPNDNDSKKPLFTLEENSFDDFHNTGIYKYSKDFSKAIITTEKKNNLLIPCPEEKNRNLLLISLISEDFEYYGDITCHDADIRMNNREGRSIVYIAADLSFEDSYISIERTNSKTKEIYVDVLSVFGYKTYTKSAFSEIFGKYLVLEQENDKLIAKNKLLADENKALSKNAVPKVKSSLIANLFAKLKARVTSSN
jgi:hypothetical protein